MLITMTVTHACQNAPMLNNEKKYPQSNAILTPVAQCLLS
ncbi:hypothetical protein UUU_32420 [Klebsiella pneumoniae subsp. pneumoniae DSM 30104 = JCM 1662 = NBRC 14940]|nr:hypothetical protein UUU_32420 [Klebsiella pneumoniae subsp. pneumoniae DSM 30104 = JCM 1662 = NBRC 14940]